MEYQEAWDELYLRLFKAEHELSHMANGTYNADEKYRLNTKAEGIRLCIQYMSEINGVIEYKNQ